MATAWIQGAKSANPGSSSATTIAVAYATANLTAGSTLVATVTWGSLDLTPTCADSVNGAWAAGPKQWSNDSGQGSAVFYKANNASTAKPTVTVSFAGNSVDYRGLVIAEIGGVDTTQPDVAGAGTEEWAPGTSANSISSGNISTATDGDFIYGSTVKVYTGGEGVTAGTDFVLRDSITAVVPVYTEGRTQTTHSATTAATFTDTYGDDALYHTYVMAFKPLAEGTNYTMAATTASYTTTCVSVGLMKALKIITSAASFALSGANINLKRGYTAVISTATFALTGINANFTRALLMIVTPAAYVFSGVNIGFSKAMKMAVAAASYSFTAIDAGFTKAIRLIAGTASYTFSAIDTSFTKALRMAAGAASYAFTGLDVLLTKATEGIAYTMQVVCAAYTFTGIDVAFTKALKMAVSVCSFSAVAKNITLLFSGAITQIHTSTLYNFFTTSKMKTASDRGALSKDMVD